MARQSKNQKEALKDFAAAVNGLADAARKVLTAWEKLDPDLSGDVARDYPFHSSFDELVGEIYGWNHTLRMMVKRGWPGPREWLPPNKNDE